MKYLCLVYADEAKLDVMPQHEVDALIDEVLANNEELEASGQLILAEALEHVAAAMTVRVRNGRLSATDGPFAETNEQLGGFALIEASDLNEAVQIAGRIPSARIGSIEVRPVIDLVRERSPSEPRRRRHARADRPAVPVRVAPGPGHPDPPAG
jgi:hypothetical protein